MKNNLLGLFIILTMTACQQAEASIKPTNTFTSQTTSTETPATVPTVFPTNELSPYYGEPQPAKVIINGKIYDSEIGTTKWVTEVQLDGTTSVIIGDAFAIITPMEPILTASNPSFTLKLPIPINPTELWFIFYTVSEQELNSQDSTHGAFAWNPDYKTQAYIKQTDLPLLSEQLLTFSLEPGIYVYEVHAGWGSRTELNADFGFLFEVQE
jgi:hypothetical protein